MEEDTVIFDSSLTLDQLKGMWNNNYNYTDEDIEELGDAIENAISNIIEDFIMKKEEGAN
jgi:hypothetical protein